MGDRQSVEALQWLAYIGRTRNNVTHTGNGREVHLSGVPNVKVDGYCQEMNEVFEYLGCFWHGCICMPNRHKPIGNTDRTIWGSKFRKVLHENRGLENEICSHLSPINIRDALYGCITEASKTLQRQGGGEDPLCGRY